MASSTVPSAPPPSARGPARSLPGSGFGDFFRYHGWLSPGVRLFRRLAFPAKAACIALAFVAPLMLALGHLALNATRQIRDTQQERQGVAYTRPLVALMQASQTRRLSATMGATDLPEHQAKVTAAFEALQKKQAELGTALGLREPWAALHEAHQALLKPEAGASADQRFEEHTALVQAALVLLREAADGSLLALDPELDTYHLMNVAVLRGPRLVENTARLRGLGRLVLDTKELTPARRRLLEEWMAVRGYLDEDVENSFNAVLQVTPEVEKLVDMKATDATSEAFYKAAEQQLLGPSLAGSAAEFTAAAQAAVSQQHALNLGLLERLDAQLQARIDRLQREMALEIGVSVLFVALAGYLMLAFYRVMMGGLREVSGHLEEITKGNLTTCPRPWGQDEAAALMLTMGQMQDSLRRIVGIVLEGSAQVQVASHEIAAASGDLSARTEQTAANLEETAASMEEIASTVKHTAHTVDGAMAIVRDNHGAAVRGGEVIGQAVQTMEGIQASSNRIGEIIGVIDGIAFQTNILALNAAVEAARAGEQGRGFAVVATEVRALAGRSASAAREIKALITASIEQVGQGNRIVAEAGASMREIVGNADRITGLMQEISTATREQSAGVGQVGEAVHELDRSTQQNAALVEETSAAANTLSEQARRLAQEVGFFKLK